MRTLLLNLGSSRGASGCLCLLVTSSNAVSEQPSGLASLSPWWSSLQNSSDAHRFNSFVFPVEMKPEALHRVIR